MAQRTKRSTRRATKRAPVNDGLLHQRRALEQTVRLERKVRALAGEVRRAHAAATSALCALARDVFDNDAAFRRALIDDHLTPREPASAGSSATEE